MELREHNNQFLLHAVYRTEKKNGSIEEIEFPSIVLPISKCHLPTMEIKHCFVDTFRLDFQGTVLGLLPNDNGQVMCSTVIKEADPIEMTMDEIEKKLGYPVKIVKEQKI